MEKEPSIKLTSLQHRAEPDIDKEGEEGDPLWVRALWNFNSLESTLNLIFQASPSGSTVSVLV